MMLATRMLRLATQLTAVCSFVGAAIIIIDSVWMCYGTFVRYVMRNPDATVTEATALLLVPLAFAGMPLALKDKSFPRVTFLLDLLSARWRRIVEAAHFSLMALIGAYFFIAALMALMSSYQSGASTYVLNWPEYPFWIPVAFTLGVFTFLAGMFVFRPPSKPEDQPLDVVA